MFSKNQKRKLQRYGKEPWLWIFSDEVREVRKKIYRKPRPLPESELKDLVQIKGKMTTV